MAEGMADLMEEVLHKGGLGLGRGPAQHVSHHNGLHMDDLAVQLHALEHAVEHLRQRGLRRGLVHGGAAHEEDVVARPHRQQQRLRSRDKMRRGSVTLHAAGSKLPSSNSSLLFA